MAPSNALYWLTIGILVWTVVGAEVCERDEIFPFLEFPYFKAHLQVGESLICRFKSPNEQKAYLKWECMTPRLFDGIGPYRRNVASANLQRLQIPQVIYHFKNNWCSCRIRLHRIDGTTCEREVTQFVELSPPSNVSSQNVAKVSIGATKLSWLHENIVTSGCPSINLCRDERYQRNSSEDTKMVLKTAGAFRNAIKPHPRIEFGNSFRYPFAVLDICKMKKSGLFFYTCIHRDRSRGPEEKMYMNLKWYTKPRKIKNGGSSKPGNRQKPVLQNKAKPTTETPNVSHRRKLVPQKSSAKPIQKTKATPESEVRTKNDRKLKKKERRPKVKIVKHYNIPQVSPRYQKQSLRQNFREMYKYIQMRSQLKKRSEKLDQTLTGVKIAVVGCVLLVLVSLAWFYHGTQLRNRYRQQAKCSCN